MPARGRRWAVATGVVPLLLALLLTACGEDGEGDDGTTTSGPSATATAAGDGSGDGATSSTPASGAREVVEVSTLAGEDCPGGTANADFPDVVAATFTPVDDGAWEVSATLCSLYDTPERYADAWRVVTPDGDVLGTRELLHDHAGEQPFTRSLSGALSVPEGVTRVVVEARDQANGWGGATLDVDLG